MGRTLEASQRDVKSEQTGKYALASGAISLRASDIILLPIPYQPTFLFFFSFFFGGRGIKQLLATKLHVLMGLAQQVNAVWVVKLNFCVYCFVQNYPHPLQMHSPKIDSYA